MVAWSRQVGAEAGLMGHAMRAFARIATVIMAYALAAAVRY